jgi:hypothetical protein
MYAISALSDVLPLLLERLGNLVESVARRSGPRSPCSLAIDVVGAASSAISIRRILAGFLAGDEKLARMQKLKRDSARCSRGCRRRRCEDGRTSLGGALLVVRS